MTSERQLDWEQAQSRRMMAEACISAPEGVFWPIEYNVNTDSFQLLSQKDLARHQALTSAYVTIVKAVAKAREELAEKQAQITHDYFRAVSPGMTEGPKWPRTGSKRP